MSTQVHEVLAELDAAGLLSAGGPSFLTFEREKPLSSIVQAPTVELQELPKHLKYAFLGKDETLPVIVSNKLTEE